MKTEQEQIEAIYNLIISHLFEDTVYSLAEQIHEAGYGDVSEYKAEIERLKDDYAKLQEQFAQYQMASDKEIIAQKKEAEQLFESNMKAVLEIEKKQAQNDVLNKAKERIKTAIDTYFNLDGGGYYLAEGAIDDIDGLIEEVENEN